MRKRTLHTLFFAAAFLLGGSLFAFLVWKSGPTVIWQSLVTFGVVPFFGFLTLSLINFTLYSIRWRMIINDIVLPSQRLPLRRVFFHRMSGYAAGYLTPASQVAGEPIRVAMLRSENIPLKEATSAVVLDLAFEIAAFVVFVVSGVALAVASGIEGGRALQGAGIFTGVLIIFLVLFFWTTANGKGFFSGAFRALRLDRVVRLQRAYHWLVDTEKMMTKFFAGKPLVLVSVVLLSVVVVSFKAIEALYIAHFFGASLSLRDAFLLSTLPGVVLLLPIPAGLGVYEGTNAATFVLLGLSLNAVAYTMIIRLRDFVFIGIGVIHAVRRGEKLVNRSA